MPQLTLMITEDLQSTTFHSYTRWQQPIFRVLTGHLPGSRCSRVLTAVHKSPNPLVANWQNRDRET